MSEAIEQNPNRARTDRTEANQQVRRRRLSNDPMFTSRFGISPDQLDPNNYQYRWVVDDGKGRVGKMEALDYVIVNSDEVKDYQPDIESVGGDVSTRVKICSGSFPNGQPQYTYLMKTPKDWWDEAQSDIVNQRENLMRGVEQGELSLIEGSTEQVYASKNNSLSSQRKGPSTRR